MNPLSIFVHPRHTRMMDDCAPSYRREYYSRDGKHWKFRLGGNDRAFSLVQVATRDVYTLPVTRAGCND